MRLEENIRRIDQDAKIVKEIGYTRRAPDVYMVADIIFLGSGVAQMLVIVEAKSGEAKLSPRQVTLPAEALKSGDVYISNEEAAEKLKVRPNETFQAQKIRPLVSVVGGSQSTIVRQLMNEGVDIGGRGSRFRLGVPPN